MSVVNIDNLSIQFLETKDLLKGIDLEGSQFEIDTKQKLNDLFQKIITTDSSASKHYTFHSPLTFITYLEKRLSLCKTIENPLSETEYLKKVYEIYLGYDRLEGYTKEYGMYGVSKYFEYFEHLNENNVMFLAGKTSEKVEHLENQLYLRGINIEKIKQFPNITHASYSEDFERKMRFLNAMNSAAELKSNSGTINWSGDALQLTELIKALIESKKITGHTDKEIFEIIFKVFNMDYSRDIKKDRLSTIRKRTINKTRFLDELQINLTAWIDDKDN